MTMNSGKSNWNIGIDQVTFLHWQWNMARTLIKCINKAEGVAWW